MEVRVLFWAPFPSRRGHRWCDLLGIAIGGQLQGFHRAGDGDRVGAKPPFTGPETVLAYLSRYTHRVAISNSRLLRFDKTGVTFRYKDYRRANADRQQVMTLGADEFIRCFLLHVLPKGFHRIRHYGLLTGATRKGVLDHVRQLLGVPPLTTSDTQAEPDDFLTQCPCCGGDMAVVETFARWCRQRAPPHGVAPTGITMP